MTYRTLDAGEILVTLERLGQRIEERFPGSGLGRVSRDLLGLARDCAREAEVLSRPNWPVRLAVIGLTVLLIVGVVVALVRAARLLGVQNDGFGLGEFFQVLESLINEVVFLGIAVFFLGSIEARLKRRTALRYLHQLRSIAHVVDMHQLTKDPDHLLVAHADTASSPRRMLTRPELGRYLDYCSELLSVTGKLAALFVQGFSDGLVLQSVNEIEDLTNGLSRKIWQKITLLTRD